VGTLRIEGQGIERLVLQDSTGRRTVHYYREPNLVLRAGNYRLEEVVLQGDYSSFGLGIPAAAQALKIEPGGLMTLKLGAALLFQLITSDDETFAMVVRALTVGSAVTANWPTHMLLVLGVSLLAGAIMGVCVFLISLSFVLVGLRSPLFRPRLFACLRLPSGSAPGDKVAVADTPGGG